jgi:KDO2-lipid IV(A) lauroyltransferase
MQWKLARKSRFAARYHDWALSRGFPVLLRVAPLLPRWFLFLGSRVVFGSVMLVYPGPKRQIERNLRQILGAGVAEREVRRARRRMTRNFAYYWVDLFRFCQLPAEHAFGLLSHIEGLEHLDAATEARRAVILLTAHLGNWELGAVFMRERRLPLAVVYVEDQFPAAESVRAYLRHKIQVEEIAIDPRAELSSLPVLRALRQGRVVALQGDRDFNDRGEWVPFFGRPAPFPLGPILLARMTGAVLLPVFIVYDERYHLEVHFRPPIEVDPGGDRTRAARRALGEWVRALEEAVARWPTQWYTFYHPWDGAPAAAQEAPAAAESSRREAV